MFHINPETGDVGTCEAKRGKCPFGGTADHFTTAEAARAHYEAQQEKLPKIKGTESGAPVLYDISVGNLELAKSAIEKANRRLEKAGVTERFSFTEEEYLRETENPKNGIKMAERRVRLLVNTPSVKFEGYTFMAAIEKAEQGFVVKAATGFNLFGYSPDSLRCDACGKAIGRQKTYLVQDDDGKMLQVGSSCVKNYFGVQPEGLWALTFDPIQRAQDSDHWSHGPSQWHDSSLPTEDVVAYALAVSDGGERFVSRAASQNYGGESTADQVRSAIYSSDRKWVQEMQEKASGYRDEAKRLIEKFKAYDIETDYGRNMSVIASGEYTQWRHMNILVSGLSELAREKREAAKKRHAEQWGDPTPGFAGVKGDKMKGRKLRVFKIFTKTDYDPYSYRGDERTTSRVTFRDEDNHEVVWWAPREIFLKEGAEVEVQGGTIKQQDNFRGVDQTVVWRLKLDDEGNPEDA